jgi:hypothetical protein
MKEKEPTRQDNREYLETQAPLRAKWLDKSLPPEVREEAHRELLKVRDAFTEKFPPLTGIFAYTQEDVDEAKKHGF